MILWWLHSTQGTRPPSWGLQPQGGCKHLSSIDYSVCGKSRYFSRFHTLKWSYVLCLKMIKCILKSIIIKFKHNFWFSNNTDWHCPQSMPYSKLFFQHSLGVFSMQGVQTKRSQCWSLTNTTHFTLLYCRYPFKKIFAIASCCTVVMLQLMMPNVFHEETNLFRFGGRIWTMLHLQSVGKYQKR